MAEEVSPVEFALLASKVETLAESEKALEAKVAALEAQDKNRMRWAIGALGGLVMALFTYIWAFKVDGK